MSAIFENTNECIRLAKQILTFYTDTIETDCVLELLHFSENLTYLVKDDGGRNRAILRLSRPDYHTLEELEAEIRWMIKLRRDTGLIMREPIADGDGKYVHTVQGEDGTEYYGTMFTYLSGNLLEKIPLSQQTVWFERLGEITAIFHNHTHDWSESRSLPRFHWNYETMLGMQAIWGDWRKVPTLIPQMSSVLDAADGLIRRRLEEYGTTKENYGLIHGDLRGANLIAKGETLKIIDFDDCGYGWYMQDLAASLSFVESESVVPQLIEAWIKGYRRLASLREEDIDMIPTFIMMRRLQLLAWIASRRNSDAVQEIKGDFASGTVELAKKYVGRDIYD